MKLLETVLVATDFGQGADNAVKTALFVAKTFHSEVVLLYVIPRRPASPPAMETAGVKAADRLRDIAKEIEAEEVRVETIVASGDASDQIVQIADERGVNVIVLGAGERAGTDRFRVGTLAAKVCRSASKPVWLVKPGHAAPIKKIVCPVDFSEASRRAMRNAVHLARNSQAELTVLTVVQPLSSRFLGMGRVSDETKEAHAKDQQVQFDRFLGDFDFHNVHWNKVVRRGEPEQGILAVVLETEADLLVMGTRGRTGLSRILLGSIAEKVAREMPCSMIVVKSEHAIRLRLDGEVGDVKAQYMRGQQLLEQGFPAEARRQFEQCVARDRMYTPAWEGLAAALRRLGREKEAEQCVATAKDVIQALSHGQAAAEARSRHLLLGRGRGRV